MSISIALSRSRHVILVPSRPRRRTKSSRGGQHRLGKSHGGRRRRRRRLTSIGPLCGLVAILGSALALSEFGSPAAHAAPGEGAPVLTVDGLAADSPTPPAVSWTTGTGVPGSVYISEEAAERLFAIAPQGRQEAPWLRSGRRYELRLYANNGRRKLIATLEVENGRAATRILARADQPPRTPEAVNATIRFTPVLGFAVLLALLGWYVRERRT